MSSAWQALAAARRREVPRRPFVVDGVVVGSVALAHDAALAPWRHWIEVRDDALRLIAAPAQRNAALAEINAELHRQGLVRAWRDETYALVAAPGAAPVALIERAAARFWGSLTFGAHANGYVADARGRPTRLWIARRSWSKPTDPGLLDNLVGGGVPHGQTPFEALVREGFEEAGLDAARMRSALPGRVIALRCDIAEGFMHEHLHTFDLQLPDGLQPVNQDGEVVDLQCVAVAEAMERASRGEMTLDASLVTLDFGLRHRLITDPTLARELESLLVPNERRD